MHTAAWYDIHVRIYVLRSHTYIHTLTNTRTAYTYTCSVNHVVLTQRFKLVWPAENHMKLMIGRLITHLFFFSFLFLGVI